MAAKDPIQANDVEATTAAIPDKAIRAQLAQTPQGHLFIVVRTDTSVDTVSVLTSRGTVALGRNSAESSGERVFSVEATPSWRQQTTITLDFKESSGSVRRGTYPLGTF